MAVYLKDLYFGCADGDTEANEKDFLDLFYKGNNKYDEIVNNPLKFIIYGQKGTGKTILGRYIEKTSKSKDTYCKIFNKDDIILIKMIEKSDEFVYPDETIHLLKWIIYYRIYQMIKETKVWYDLKFGGKWFFRNIQKWKCKKSLKILKKIFIERYSEGENFGFDEYVCVREDCTEAEIASELENVTNSKVRGTNKYTENKKYIKKEFYEILENVEKNVLTCLKTINVTLILDDLDELDINFNGEKNNSALVLNKLIEAFKNINIKFCNEEIKKSKCILLIRSDIIEELNKRSSNLNKIIVDNSIELYWIDKENVYPEKQMLMEMILNKIKRTCPEYSCMDNALLYKKLFPERINNKWHAINYMINNSFGRPRDIISFLEIIKRRYPNETAFRATMFKECKQAYSDAFLKELYNEMKIHLPLDVVEDYLNLIRDFGRDTFYLSDLKKYYKPRTSNYKNINNLNKCIEDLYKFGVLGNFKKIGDENNKSYSYSWGYRNDGKPNANLEQKFSVHYGLRNILNTN